jgi:ClpP class serine protease
MPPNIHKKIWEERYQNADSRKDLFSKLKNSFSGRALVTFFTSFDFETQIDDKDADMLQSVLHNTDLTKGLVLMINSPGGDPLAAERIAKICRSYSGTKDYWALVPGRAKSAATMICMGASKILMAPTAELGPVDPQVRVTIDGEFTYLPADVVTSTYDQLLKDATTGSSTTIEPYIQQLGRFDAREVAQFKSWIALSKDISIKLLAAGMMTGKSDTEIEAKIRIFLEASQTRDHGRPIYSDAAKRCELNIEEIDLTSHDWNYIYELYVRTDMYVSSFAATAVESLDEALFYSPPP